MSRAVGSKAQVRGLDNALSQLRKIEPDYVKGVRRRAAGIAAPAVKAAKEEFVWQASVSKQYQPDRPGGRRANVAALLPLSGMVDGELIRGRGGKTRWNASKVKSGIRFRMGGPAKRARVHRVYRMFSIIQGDPAGAIYDMAGKRNGAYNPSKRFEESLEDTQRPHKTGGGTGPSRYMWPAVEGSIPKMEGEILEIVAEIERKVNRNLRVRSRT